MAGVLDELPLALEPPPEPEAPDDEADDDGVDVDDDEVDDEDEPVDSDEVAGLLSVLSVAPLPAVGATSPLRESVR